MVSAYGHNDLLLGIIDTVSGAGADLDAAELAFQSCSGDFAARFAAAVQAAVAGQVRPEVFIAIPQQSDGLSKSELDALVRPAAGFLKSYPSKPELLDELDAIERRQRHRPAWIPRITTNGQPWDPDTDGDEAEESERDVTVEAFAELGPVVVPLPAVWDERSELTVADGGIGQLELVLYRLLGVGECGDWRGELVLDAEANEALVPEEVRWWAPAGHEPKSLPPAEDAGVASELLATMPSLGGVPVRETDGAIEVMALALAGAGVWRHSPQWVMQSWDPGGNAEMFTAARASLAAWADDEAGTGLLVHVDGAMLHQHEGILPSPGALHAYLLCVTRAGNGSDELALVHRLVLSCPGENWCSRGGCATAKAATVEVLASLLAPAAESAQLAAAANRHDTNGLYQDLYGPRCDDTFGEPVLKICSGVLAQAGWNELIRTEIDGGLEELLVRRGTRFLLVTHDPVTRQIMLSDGTRELDLLMQMFGDHGVIVGEQGQETVDTTDETVKEWGLDALTAASDVLRGRIDMERESAFEPVQATLLGVHPAGWGVVNAPGAESLVASQLTGLLPRIGTEFPTA